MFIVLSLYFNEWRFNSLTNLIFVFCLVVGIRTLQLAFENPLKY